MDIVERLRNLEWMIDQKELNEAADEIERLRKENAELKELLQATVDYTGAVASSPNISFYPSPKWHLVTNGAIQEITIAKATGGK
jgi:hypothetical protein